MTKAIQKNTFGDNGSFELAQREAKAFSQSSLVPETYQNNIPNTLIAMEIANRIGASTLAVMQHLYIVHGKPAFDSTFLISTVNASKRFSPIRYRMEGDQGKDSWGCRAYAQDRETGEECVGPLVTIAMAKAEGWYSKKGSKWQTMPELMLHYRAAAFWTRIYSPELSMGIHTTDELRDSIDAPPAKVVRDLDELTEELRRRNGDDSKDEESGPVADPFDELSALAEQQWGENKQAALDHFADAYGYQLGNLTEEQAVHLLDELRAQK